MKLTIEINMNNAAFEHDPSDEVIRILKEYMQKLAGCGSAVDAVLRDVNGNKVGVAVVEED